MLKLSVLIPVYNEADTILPLLDRVKSLIQERGFVTNNVDAVIVAQRPKLGSFIPFMRGNIAGILGITVEAVSVKATTTERLGSRGQGDGIAAEAVVSIIPIDS